MSFFDFIYPRTITVLRPVLGSDLKYEELNYSPVMGLSSLIASIQLKGYSNKPITGLPADVSNETYWDIYIPFDQNGLIIARGLILLRDKIQDDTGITYEVVGPYWDSLGYNLRGKLLSP